MIIALATTKDQGGAPSFVAAKNGTSQQVATRKRPSILTMFRRHLSDRVACASRSWCTGSERSQE